MGKKLGVGEVELPEDGEQQKELLQLVEAVANRIASDNLPIQVTKLSKPNALQTFGAGIQDQSHLKKKKKKDAVVVEQVLVPHIANLILAIPPSIPYATTGSGISKISLDFKQSDISCAKKISQGCSNHPQICCPIVLRRRFALFQRVIRGFL